MPEQGTSFDQQSRTVVLPAPNMVVASEAMQVVITRVHKAAVMEVVPVMITGESGVGKQQVALYIHDSTNAVFGKQGRFGNVNCVGFARSLLESELFGHERGAFTGAEGRHIGHLETAHGGTLFLDEIGRADFRLQTRLLKFLDDGEITRMGSTIAIQVRARVVAATNRNLQRAVASKQFLRDLYYRLNVYPIHIPPLRERLEEVGPLAKNCIARFNQVNSTAVEAELQPAVLAKLQGYSWPGNVREFFNVIERAIVNHGPQGELVPDDIEFDPEMEVGRPAVKLRRPVPESVEPVPEPVAEPGGESATPQTGAGSLFEIARVAAETAEREAISRVLRECRWNRRQAADTLGVSYKTLLNKIKTLGIGQSS